MDHEQRECWVLERAQRGTAQDQFAKAAVAVGAHNQKVRAGRGRCGNEALADRQVAPIHLGDCRGYAVTGQISDEIRRAVGAVCLWLGEPSVATRIVLIMFASLP